MTFPSSQIDPSSSSRWALCTKIENQYWIIKNGLAIQKKKETPTNKTKTEKGDTQTPTSPDLPRWNDSSDEFREGREEILMN